MKLKQKDIKPLRERLHQEQNYLCALCQELLTTEEAVLDHDHKTGQIRGTVHRGCNTMLGRIENAMPRSRITEQRLETFLANVRAYRQALRQEIHPTYKEPKHAKRTSDQP